MEMSKQDNKNKQNKGYRNKYKTYKKLTNNKE